MGVLSRGGWRARRGTRLVGIVVVAAIGVTVLAGCLPDPDPWTAPTRTGVGNGHHVGIIGDSLVVRAQRGIPADWSKHFVTDAMTNVGFHVSTTAATGATTDDLFGADSSTFTGFPSPGAEIQVIGLGTNDAHDNQVPVTRYEANLRRWIGSQPKGTCFALVNVFAPPAWRLNVTAPAYNAAIKRIVADTPSVHLVDWNSFALAHMSMFPDPNDPHPNDSGQAAYRVFLTAGAATCAAALDA